MDFIPVVGTVKMGTEAVWGRDYVAGRDLSTLERSISGGIVVASLIPGAVYVKGGKVLLRGGRSSLKAFGRGAKVSTKVLKEEAKQLIKNLMETPTH